MSKDEINIVPKSVRKRTVFGSVFIMVGVLFLETYNPKISISIQENLRSGEKILSLVKNGVYTFFNDQTLPSPNDSSARCSVKRQKPWHQRWGLCWE